MSFVQSISRSSGAFDNTSTFSVTYTSNNGSGNLLIVVSRLPFGSGNTFTVTDSNLNRWIKALSFINGTDREELWYAANCVSGSNTVTITSGGNAFFRMIAAEYSNTTQTFDRTTWETGSSATPNSANITTRAATELLLGFVANSNVEPQSFTPNAGWTVRNNSDNNLFLADQAVSSIGTYSFGGSQTSSSWGAGIVSFGPASLNGPFTNSAMMMGCGK